MIRKAAFLSLVISITSLYSLNGWSLAITDVGGVDRFIASSDLRNSGSATEEAWVESILDFDVTFNTSYDSNGSDWTLLDGMSDVYAASINTASDYFLIKLGTGGTSLQSHYLFENIGDLDWAVVDFSAAGIDFSIKNISIDRMSHVGEFSSVSVPEPSSIFLIGLGLLGLIAQRKRH
ncbi:PEP-CTERM sorting domain-containing protein [Teredinibacter sp. KSP-S5-2]|uniref:PEP-CTERM sorting domain-containing protein n=1 Tax=Teredinibacter sp. KSP-S5-2 TaxID=3034506 RepID=UPI002934E609|nr:PEP-CTERM sorting domain-containing protein [Teredinibacter sp. KSP-S5-2]WNO09879.1 PEP-CTERM sorting domain-containing protein [Teredinibacter sp. KSP-S5-2]